MLATPELIHEAGQLQRLADVLPPWLAEVPLYQAPGADDPVSALGRFRRLPLITKQDIRRGFPQNFLGDRAQLEGLIEEELIELEQTSGTSEPRTPLLLPTGWWPEQERRALWLNGTARQLLVNTPEPRRVTISSPVCSGDVCYTGVPSRNDRTIGKTIYLSLSKYPFLWSEAELARMAAETLDWEPDFLDVDPVYGMVFSRYCERKGIRLPSLRFIICSYEFVSVLHRRILQRAFGVPVFNLYGSTETGHLLMETGQGEMSPSCETAVLEVIERDSKGVGDLVVSTLTNDFMPLLRYRIGDLVQRQVNPYGTRYLVHGRTADAFRKGDGTRVTTWQIDQCFEDVPGVAHYQFIEHRSGEWVLRFVPDLAGPETSDLRRVEDRLRTLLAATGPIRIEATDTLVAESSGKFRLCYPARSAHDEDAAVPSDSRVTSPGPPGNQVPESAAVCRSARGG